MPRVSCREIPLCAYADPLIARLKKRVPTAIEGLDVDAVHDARVAARRLKAALDLLRPIIDDEETADLRRAIRRVRRRLGPLRDLDVMLAHLRELGQQPRHAAAAQWMISRLEGRRAGALRKVRRKTSPRQWIARLDAWRTLRQRVVEHTDAIKDAMHASLQRQSTLFCAQADWLAARLLDGQTDGEYEPHELRITGKQLRYTFEMLARAGERPSAATRRLFKRVQDALGLWHDYVVLAEHVMRESVAALLPHHDPRLQSQVLMFARLALQRSEHHLRRFSTLWRNNRGIFGCMDVAPA